MPDIKTSNDLEILAEDFKSKGYDQDEDINISVTIKISKEDAVNLFSKDIKSGDHIPYSTKCGICFMIKVK